MHFTGVALLAGLVSAVSAHFHLEYPQPRGPWNMPNELTFCGEYKLPAFLDCPLMFFRRRLWAGHDEPHDVPAQRRLLLAHI